MSDELLPMNPPSPRPTDFTVIGEVEPDGEGGTADVTTIFLTASRCPIGCTMCDLHVHTLPHPTPPGAITHQITTALQQQASGRTVASDANDSARPSRRWIKLYNSGNFFDPASIPPAEYADIAKLCEPFSRIIIENHPRFGASRLRPFQSMLRGQLEIAVGLETVQPRWLNRLNKQMTRDQFDRYARSLREQKVDLRVFLIVGVPGISVAESLRWARLSIRHAIRQSARHISLIAARTGHGWAGQADALPDVRLDDLRDLHATATSEYGDAVTIMVDDWGLKPDEE